MLRLNFKWNGKDVSAYDDAEDIVVSVDGLEIYDHEFEYSRYSEYASLFDIVNEEFGERVYEHIKGGLLVVVLPKHMWGYVYDENTLSTETFNYYGLEDGEIGFTQDEFSSISSDRLALVIDNLI